MEETISFSDKQDKILPILLDIQKKMKAVIIPKNGFNPHFKSKYVTYDDAVPVIVTPLNEAGCILLHPTVVIDGKEYIETRIVHAESGQWIRTLVPLKQKDQGNPQQTGSAITYAKRYGLLNIIAISGVAESDDDGNLASSPPATNKSNGKASAAIDGKKNPNATNGNGRTNATPRPWPADYLFRQLGAKAEKVVAEDGEKSAAASQKVINASLARLAAQIQGEFGDETLAVAQTFAMKAFGLKELSDLTVAQATAVANYADSKDFVQQEVSLFCNPPKKA